MSILQNRHFDKIDITYIYTVEPRLYEHQGTFKIRSSYPEFVLRGVICIENALKRTEIMFVLTGNSF